jgi:hypothetical protein
MPSMRQCNREDIHADRHAWFGVWPTGVPPPRHHTLSPDSAPFIASQSPTPRRTKERCSKAACNGFTAKGCPYRHCASHCRKAGGCTKHKVPVAPLAALSQSPFPLSASQPPVINEYQNIAISEEDALMAGLEASRLHTSTSSVATSYASSSRVTVLSAAESSVRHSPAQPKISSQLGGAWLEVLDGDVQDELQKEKLQLAKAEAAAEAKKSVDVLWYDQVRVL